MPSFVLLGSPAPWALPRLDNAAIRTLTGQNWAKAPCSLYAKADGGWLCRRDAILILAPNHAFQKSVQQADCSSGLSRPSTPAAPASATGPFLRSLWYPDGSGRGSKGSSSQAAPRPPVYLINQRAQQRQLIWRAHKGSAQATTECRRVLSSAQPREFFVLILKYVKWCHNDNH